MNSRGESAVEPRRAIVIVLRGLGPVYIGGYGNEWIRTSTLDRLCSRAIVFDQHYSTTTSRTEAGRLWFAERPDLLGALTHAGVGTIRVRNCPTPNDIDGWVFDESVSCDDQRPWSLLPIRHALYPLLAKLPANAPALVWIEAECLAPPWRPLRKWLDYYFLPDEDDDNPPTPWLDPLPDVIAKDDDHTFERLQSTFAASVSALSRSLTKLLAGLRARGFGQDALLMVTSDLGFPLGEHGPVGYTSDLIQESLVHLPLILRLPNCEQAGRRIEAMTQPADLAPTITEYFGLSGDHAGSLLPLARGEATEVRRHLIIKSNSQIAVRTPEWLLVRDKVSSRVYQQPADRWQVHDLAGTMDEELARLEALLNPAAK